MTQYCICTRDLSIDPQQDPGGDEVWAADIAQMIGQIPFPVNGCIAFDMDCALAKQAIEQKRMLCSIELTDENKRVWDEEALLLDIAIHKLNFNHAMMRAASVLDKSLRGIEAIRDDSYAFSDIKTYLFDEIDLQIEAFEDELQNGFKRRLIQIYKFQ